MNPKISVIVPVYNVERDLPRCLDSILNQTYKNFELLLVDDGSTDNSGSICDDYQISDNRIKVFHKANGGVSSARNFGISQSTGDFIAFCDSDDYVGSNWLISFSDVWQSNLDLGIEGIVYLVDKDVKNMHMKSYLGSLDSDKQMLIVDMMNLGVYGYPVTKLFKRSIIISHNILFDIQSNFREDEQFFSKYLEYVKTFVTIDALEYFYFLPSSDKKYKGNPYYSLKYIFYSLDNIFEGNLPKEICLVHFSNIRDCIVTNILSRKVIDNYMLDLYKRMVIKTNHLRTFRERCIFYLIYNSPKLKLVSYLFLKLIHH